MRTNPAFFRRRNAGSASFFTLNSSRVKGAIWFFGPTRTSFRIPSRSMNTAFFIILALRTVCLTHRHPEENPKLRKNGDGNRVVGRRLRTPAWLGWGWAGLSSLLVVCSRAAAGRQDGRTPSLEPLRGGEEIASGESATPGKRAVLATGLGKRY